MTHKRSSRESRRAYRLATKVDVAWSAQNCLQADSREQTVLGGASRHAHRSGFALPAGHHGTYR